MLSLLGDEHETHLALFWGSGVPRSVVGGGDLRQVRDDKPQHHQTTQQQPHRVNDGKKRDFLLVHLSSSFFSCFLFSFLPRARRAAWCAAYRSGRADCSQPTR